MNIYKSTIVLSQLNRGADTKMELSLVDKIELARTYEPITRRIVSLSIYLLVGESCFNMDTLKIYRATCRLAEALVYKFKIVW